MKCTSCNSEVPEGQIFCGICGTKIGPGRCTACGNELTPGQQFCGSCGQQINSPIDSGGTRTAGNKVFAKGKNEILACILSLIIVGVGQFYNGDTKKGFLMLVGAIITGVASAGVLWFAVAIWSAIDAYRVAKQYVPIWT